MKNVWDAYRLLLSLLFLFVCFLALPSLLIPRAHAQGVKQSSVCRHHENRQISSSTHLCVL